jgi:hypothetical protein
MQIWKVAFSETYVQMALTCPKATVCVGETLWKKIQFFFGNFLGVNILVKTQMDSIT